MAYVWSENNIVESIFMWILEILETELWLSGLPNKHLYTLSHLASPEVFSI